MSKSKIIKIGICLILVLFLVCGSFLYYNSSVKEAKAITDQAVTRKEGIPEDGIVYIEPELVSLAESLSGNADSTAAARSAFDMVNTRRQEAGLSPLTWNSGLEQAAAVRAIEASQLFSHTRPDGSDWWTVNSDLMYGENLAKGYSTADSAVQAWMDSPTHKANILDGEFKSIAITIHINNNGQWFWAQEFGY